MATFQISEYNTVVLQSKLSRMTNKAKKHGFDKPLVTIGEMRAEKHKTDSGRVFFREVRDVTVHTDRVGLEGYRLAAYLEHTPDGTSVQQLSDITIPVEYRGNNGTRCDHCHTKRYRAKSWLFQNVETGELVQVGSTCVKDYAGHDVDGLLRLLSSFLVSFGELREEEETSGISRSYPPIEGVLYIAALEINKYGFLSRSRAEMRAETPTSERVLHGVGDKEYFSEVTNEERKIAMPLALRALDYFSRADQAKASDFDWNAYLLVKRGYCRPKDFGLATALVGVLVQREERAAKAKAGFAPGHFGTVSKREVFNLKLVKAVPYESMYGEGVRHVFTGPDNMQAVWFSSKPDAICEENENVTVKATVKKHDRFNSQDQTILTRVSLA